MRRMDERSDRKAAGITISMMVIFFCLALSAAGKSSSRAAEEGEYAAYENPRIDCPETESGWYQEPPEVKLIHTEPETVTKYLITAPSGKKTEGELRIGGPGEPEESGEPEKPGEPEEPEEQGEPQESESLEGAEGMEEAEGMEGAEEKGEPQESEGPEESEDQEESPETETAAAETVISPEIWEEGENHLSVWMEAKKDGREVYREERKVRVDKSEPGKVEFVYRNMDKGYFQSSFQVTVKAADAVSGVGEIICAMPGGRNQKIEGGLGKLEIDTGFTGKITAYAVDISGRKGKETESAQICCENEAPQISLDTGAGREIWHQGSAAVCARVYETGERYGFSSGLKRVTYYIDGQVAGKKEYPSSGGEVFSDFLEFEVSKLSQNGEGIPVMIHALDWAGNTAVKIERVFIDDQFPAIKIKGVEDSAITGENVEMEIAVLEENVLLNSEIRISHTDPDEERTEIVTINLGDWEWTEGGRKKKIVLEETGIYECRIAAEDAAGHETERSLTFTIDRDSPVIRYVDQMNGANIPFFQWNYGKEEIIRDLTEYSYGMYLNGAPYFSGKVVTEEGEKLLEVRAEDAAGNLSFAKAVFTVDHTPPVIYYGEAQDGRVYDGSVNLSFWVDGAGERIKSIYINGEKQILSPDSRIFESEITESGEHSVEVCADDLAGNETVKQILFEVRAENGFEGKVIEPVKRIFSGKTERGENGSENRSEGEKCTGWGIPVLGVSVGVAVLCAFAGKWMKKKKIS